MFTIEHEFDATVITLVLLPALYMIAEDIIAIPRRVLSLLKKPEVAVDEA